MISYSQKPNGQEQFFQASPACADRNIQQLLKIIVQMQFNQKHPNVWGLFEYLSFVFICCLTVSASFREGNSGVNPPTTYHQAQL
jgi:hypothetical protein